MQFSQPRPSGRLISLTPLIDVVFILLVFFMLASSFLDWRSVDLTVSSGTANASAKQHAIVVHLKPDGSIEIGSKLVTKQSLKTTIRARLAEKADQTVIIRSDRGVPLLRAVNILDLLRAVGATKVSLSRTR
jgi:biopolymer transport protein ExbD